MKVYCDGGARGNPGPAASAFIVKDESDCVVYQEAKKLGHATNNVAEYTAVKMALDWLSQESPTMASFYLDSLLVVNQLNGIFKIKNETLGRIALKIKQLENKLGKVTYQHIPREKNKLADSLVNRALDNLPIST